MRKLSDLIRDLKQEQRRIPMQNAAALTVLGFEIQEKVVEMIGTKQSFWADLKPATIEWKTRKHLGKDNDPSSPLYGTGDFARSIEYKLIGKNKVRIFSDDPTAQYHEFGTSTQPPRPVFLLAAKLVLRDFLGKGKLQNFYLKSLR